MLLCYRNIINLLKISGGNMAKPKAAVERKSIGIRIDNELMKDLKIIAIKQERQLNLVLEDAIREYCKKNKKAS